MRVSMKHTLLEESLYFFSYSEKVMRGSTKMECYTCWFAYFLLSRYEFKKKELLVLQLIKYDFKSAT